MIKEIILKMTGLYQEMYGLRETNAMLETDLANSTRKVEQLLSSYEDQKANAQRLYDARVEAEKQVKTLTIDLDAAKETVDDLRSKLQVEQRANEVYRNSNKKWENDYNTIAQRCEDIETKDEELTAKCNEQYTTITKLNNDVENWKKEAAEAHAEVDGQIAARNELTQKLEQFRIDNDQLLKDNQALQEKVAYYKAKANHKKTTTPPNLPQGEGLRKGKATKNDPS